MSFKFPTPTLGGKTFWENQKEDKYFVLQKHITGMWSHRFRILFRLANMEIATAQTKAEIEKDWAFLQKPSLIRWLDPTTRNPNIPSLLLENSNPARRAVLKLIAKTTDED